MAVEEASKFGASVTFEQGSKHALLVITFDGQIRKHTFARSKRKSLDNQMDWVRQNIRRSVNAIRASA